MKKSVFSISLLITALLFSVCSQAAIRPSLTRVIVNAANKETSVSLINDDKTSDYLVQSWVTDLNGSDKNIPVILTPPLFKISAGREGKLRLVVVPGNLPQDRESVFWLWTQEIPPARTVKGNELTVAVRTRLKVFIRPAGITGKPAASIEQLSWKIQREGNKSWLVASNPSAFYISFSTLEISGGSGRVNVGDSHQMVPPKGQARYALPANIAGHSGKLNYSAINDFGGESPVQHASLTF